MIKSINTKEENCFVTIESSYRGSTIVWFVDELFDIRKRLATYKDGKWNFSSPNRMNDLIKLMKHNTQLKKSLKLCLDYSVNGDEIPGTVNWRCFKRKLKLKITKIYRNTVRRIRLV